MDHTALDQLVEAAAVAIDLKARLYRRGSRRNVARKVFEEQERKLEERMTDALMPAYREMMSEMQRGLEEIAPEDEKATGQSSPLLSLAFDSADPRWKVMILDGLVPVVAVAMLEAATAQMIEAGLDPRKSVKHLPGQHNQMSHGHGGGASAPDTGGSYGSSGMVQAKRQGKKWVLDDGSDLPEHLPKNIPPAWKNVEVSLDPKADMLVKGKDVKGRDQRVYSDAHWAKVAEVKFARVNELRTKQKAVRKELDQDVKNPATREEASCLRLIQATGLRPGSTSNTGAEKQAYGATTLEGRHVQVQGDKVRLKFVGKKGVDLDIPVDDPVVARDLIARKAEAGADGKIFSTSQSKLSNYAHNKDGGGFKTKDFRTAKGTDIAARLVSQMKTPATAKEYKAAVLDVSKKVAAQLGNTPAVARQSYIDPAVFAGWRVE